MRRLARKSASTWSNHPELVLDPANALECGVADFVLCRCVQPAAADDVITVTRRLNGGLIGLDDRKQWLKRWKAALGESLASRGYDITAVTNPRPLNLLLFASRPCVAGASVTLAWQIAVVRTYPQLGSGRAERSQVRALLQG